ncbi:MAG TPA: hypothetical protein VGF86_00670 [Candidatus Tumulicola sp.]|jgi:hypothetical protein
MKYFLITYALANGSPEDWYPEVEEFIATLEADPVLGDKITHRSLKRKDGATYYHLATTADDAAAKALGETDFFEKYTQRCDSVSNGAVEVIPLELVAETSRSA